MEGPQGLASLGPSQVCAPSNFVEIQTTVLIASSVASDWPLCLTDLVTYQPQRDPTSDLTNHVTSLGERALLLLTLLRPLFTFQMRWEEAPLMMMTFLCVFSILRSCLIFFLLLHAFEDLC